MNRYEFKKKKFRHEELLNRIKKAVGKPPSSYEVSYDNEGNISEFTLIFDPSLTSTEEKALAQTFSDKEMNVRKEE